MQLCVLPSQLLGSLGRWPALFLGASSLVQTSKCSSTSQNPDPSLPQPPRPDHSHGGTFHLRDPCPGPGQLCLQRREFPWYPHKTEASCVRRALPAPGGPVQCLKRAQHRCLTHHNAMPVFTADFKQFLCCRQPPAKMQLCSPSFLS